jgi:S1-C subfamily serine protease
MSEEEVPAGPPAWPGGARPNDPWGGAGWTSPPPTPGWWPQQYYTYEPPPPPRRTSRLIVFGVLLVIAIFAASAAATAVIATRGLGGSGNTSGVKAAIVDINTSLGGGAAAAGTGIVVSSTGVVLTNFHVVNGWQSISVTLTATRTPYMATVIGTDSNHDVAVIQLEGASGLTTAPIGDSASVQIGDSVTALGNAEGRGGAPAVVTGSVTALGQQITAADETGQNTETLTGMIQTNAPIQPGDSGGPLVNSDGKVIGMDTAASGARRGPQPSSVQAFAIPIDTALNYAHQILSHPNTQPAGALLGVCVSDSTSPPGAVVTPSSAPGCSTGIASGTPASTTPLAAGDVIISLGGNAVISESSLKVILQGDHSGQSVVVIWVDPSGGRHQATVTLAAASPQQ